MIAFTFNAEAVGTALLFMVISCAAGVAAALAVQFLSAIGGVAVGLARGVAGSRLLPQERGRLVLSTQQQLPKR